MRIQLTVVLISLPVLIGAQPIEFLSIGAKDFAVLPSLPQAPTHQTTFQAHFAEALGADALTVTAMTDQDDGTAEFPIEANLQSQIGRITEGRLATDRRIVVFSGYANAQAGALFLMGADSKVEAPAAGLDLQGFMTGAAASLGKELLILDLVPAPGVDPEALSMAATRTVDAGKVPALVIVWKAPPDRASWDAVLAASGDAFVGGDLMFGGNGDGSVDAAEWARSTTGRLKALAVAELSSVSASGAESDFALVPSRLGELGAQRAELQGLLKQAEELGSGLDSKAAADILVKVEEQLVKGDSRELLRLAPLLATELADLKTRVDRVALLGEARRAVDEAMTLASFFEVGASDPSGFASANALLQSARALDGQPGQSEAAANALRVAGDRLALTTLAVARGRLKADLAPLEKGEWQVYAPQTAAKVFGLIEQASQKSPLEEVRAHREAIELVPAMKTEGFEGLMAMARPAMTPEEFATAEVYLATAAAIAPENTEPRLLLSTGRATLKFQPGQSVAGPAGMTFVYVPHGRFMMGSPASETGRDADEVQRSVTLSRGFFLTTTEITNAQWRAVMGDRLPSSTEGLRSDQHPVVGVTHDDCVAFCDALQKLTPGRIYRLPTEAEWEYACRAGSITAFSNDRTSLTPLEAAFYDPSTNLESAAVVATSGAPNKWGLHDMHGNVWEWCADWSAPYDLTVVVDPKGPESRPGSIDSSAKVARGGSWFDGPEMARSANRGEFIPVVGNAMIGFRVALDPDFATLNP